MRILVPIDGSPLAETAVPYAEFIARGARADLVLLTVGRACEAADAADTLAALEERLNERIARLTGLHARGYVAVNGAPARAIAQAVDEQEIDLVVMATHRRTGVDRIIFGSVSEDVLDAVHVPVLLVRPAVEPGEAPDA
jgi:nucleotide-binding universal stress UspA family protein